MINSPRILAGYLGRGERPELAVLNTLVALRVPGNTMRYYLTFGRFPNYLNPQMESEKIQWRKLFDRNPLFAVFCDKLATRDYAAARAPAVRLTELYWSGIEAGDMPLETLPLPFVIKPNNRSGAHIFVRRPEDLDPPAIRRQCRAWLRAAPYGRATGEWGYGQVPTRIMIEAFLSDGDDLAPPPTYEFFVYQGRVQAIYYSVPRLGGRPRKRGLFTTDWQTIAADRWRMKGFDPIDADVPRPATLGTMIDAAERIAGEVDYARVDLYTLGGEVYLGEVTLYPHSGYSTWVPKGNTTGLLPPEELDAHFGAMWRLPEIPFWTCVRRGLFGF